MSKLACKYAHDTSMTSSFIPKCLLPFHPIPSVTASDSNTDTESLVKPKRNRFSVEMDGNQSPWEREDSLSGRRVKEEEKEMMEKKDRLTLRLPPPDLRSASSAFAG